MINYEKVAEKIFSIIKGHDHDLVMFTEDGMETSSAEEARRFFVSKPNYMVTLDGEARHIKINKNSNVPLEDMESVMKQLKNLATSNMLKTEIRVFGKEITPKDFAYQAKNLKGTAMENIQEASFSRMHGFKKTSYQTLESTKIVVRHRRPVDEDVQGSRARNIQAIFIEHAGERFRFPHNNLAGARAMARHINEGGEMGDSIGKYIIESISNYNKLMEFVRYARTNKLINEESEDIVKTVRESMGIIRREIGQLQGAKTYESIKKRIEESDVNVIEETGEDVSDLQDMFTVRKFDEEIGNVLPIVKKLMDNKQEWRDALVEASEKQIFISEKSDISETDIFEFDSPTQRMGYKVRDIAERMIGESDLQTFVGKVAGKLIEGEQISAFEKKVVGNVLGNAVIREEEEICEECGEVMEKCGCTTKDVLDLISEQFELKMKMVEHEDIFTEGVLSTRTCPNCGDYSMDLQDRYGDDLFYVCDTCGEEMNDRVMELPDVVACPSCRDEAYSFSKGRCDTCDYTEDEASLYQESEEQLNENLPTHGQHEWWKNDPDDLLAYVYWLRGQVPPADKDAAWEELKASLSKKHPAPDGIDPMLGDGPLQEEDHHAGEVEAGAHSGMPSHDIDDECSTCGGWGFISSSGRDWRDVEPDDPDTIACPDCDAGYEDEDDGQPSEYEEWQDVYGGDDWDFGQYESRMLELAGIPIKESNPEKAASGKCDPEDFMDDCPDCGGTGKAQDSIFDDDECSTCGGEGYV